jgi:uncharacterized protein YggE
MSTVWKVALLVTLVAAVFVAAAVLFTRNGEILGQPVQANTLAAIGSATDQTGITIVAQGEVKAKPDVAYISLGVRTTAVTAREAMSQNNAAIAAVIAKMETLGVAKKDMQTGSINLYPQTKPIKQDDPSTEVIVGYWANNTLNVTVNDLGKVGDILDASVSAGANSVSGIRFGIKDDSKLRDDALKAAVQTARAKADLVAAGLGLKVTGVQNVSIENYGPSAPVYQYAGAAMAKSADSSVPVEAGEMTFTASVRVVFKF